MNITIDRAVVEQALEALEWADNGYEEGLPIQVSIQKAITALRAALSAEQPAGEPVPPFGSKRKAAMAIYTPPFKFYGGYIYDSKGHMVADQDGIDGEVEKSVVARVRGWGRIGYMPNPEELQDEVGHMMADALTAYYTHPQPQAVPLTDEQLLEMWSGNEARPTLGKNKVLAFARVIEAAHGIGGPKE